VFVFSNNTAVIPLHFGMSCSHLNVRKLYSSRQWGSRREKFTKVTYSCKGPRKQKKSNTIATLFVRIAKYNLINIWK